MCAERVRPEHPERLVHLDTACASGCRFFFLMRSHCLLYHLEEGDVVLPVMAS